MSEINQKKKKMKKKILLTVALSHSSMFHMQAPISSDEAAHTLLHLLSITARDIAIIRDEVVAEVVNKEKKKIPGFRQVLAFLQK